MNIKKEFIIDNNRMRSEVVDRNKNNIFAFWESEDEIPAYLELCKRTWYQNVPNCEIHIINYQNIQSYIGNTYDLDKLKRIPLAMQSDIISAATLEKFGGLFLDIDCIVTKNIFNIFNKISEDKLIAFGSTNNSTRKTIHLAVLYSKTPNNILLSEWRKTAQEKLNHVMFDIGWDHFGNSIINPLLNNPIYFNNYYIVERTISGNILESAVLEGYSKGSERNNYIDFYFNRFTRLNSNILDLIKCGIVSLHNSWTPKEFTKIKNINKFLEKEMPIVDLLNYALISEAEAEADSIITLESYLKTKLRSEKIFYKMKYRKNILVVDFKVNNFSFAFDIVEKDGFEVTLIIRDKTKIEDFKAVSKFNFIKNKVKIVEFSNIIEVTSNITRIFSYFENNFHISSDINFNNKLVIDGNYINLQKIDIVKGVLFIDGIGIPIGKDIRNYQDISYKLVLKGNKHYEFILAKADRFELTEKYSIEYSTDYSKCWFTTPKFKGIDINHLESNKYDVFLEIKLKDEKYLQYLRSELQITSSSKEHFFESSCEGCSLWILRNN